MRVVIVGGVAGGASAAARLRRLDERAEIAIYERGEHISYANCGLPYHVGGAIDRRNALLLQTPASMKARFAIDVHVRHEVIAIDRAKKTVTVRNLETGKTFDDRYDRLVLAPGAKPIVPKIPGIDHPRVLTLRNLADMDRILDTLEGGAKRAVVVGGGYVGIEMTENLVHRGVSVQLVEMGAQVLTFVDPDIAAYAHETLRAHGVELHLGDALASIGDCGSSVCVTLGSGRVVDADFVLLAIGVAPEVSLAREAGLDIGKSGAIVVDDRMRTSDESIFAVGDAVEVTHFVTRTAVRIPLAGPANRMGRIAASVICGLDARYDDTQGTGILKVFDRVIAATGAPSWTLRAAGIPFRTATIHAGSHASYYPGASTVHLKLLYDERDGGLLGAQACGHDGVDKRIDVLATAIRHHATVYDLEDYELAYAPPFGSARDPVNVAGFVASNDLRGTGPLLPIEALDRAIAEGAFLLDVRSDDEVARGRIGDAKHIPLDELRARLGELPRNRTIVVYCAVGLRAYVAQRILLQNDYRALDLSGGFETYRVLKESGSFRPV